MSVLKLAITTGRPDTYLESNFEVVGGKQAIAQRVVDYINRVFTGNELAESAGNPPSIGITVQGNETQATGDFDLLVVIATDAISINGVAFTCTAGAPGANQFQVGIDDDATAANMAAAINASVSALVAGYVTAEQTGFLPGTVTVTITSSFYGLAGNQTLIASADATITASGTHLTGGAADATAQTLNF